MSNPPDNGVSRRSILRAAVTTAAFSGATVLLQTLGSTPAYAGSGSVTASDNEKFLEVMRKLGYTDVTGIRAEYVDTARDFEYELPQGEEFPAQSSIPAASPKMFWEPGIGAAEAFFVWLAATAVAAHQAHLAGDAAETQRLLDEAEAGYAVPDRLIFWSESEEQFDAALRNARQGDFAALAGLAGA